MKCIKCGREIPDGDLFCFECSLSPAEPYTAGQPKASGGQSCTGPKREAGQKPGRRAGAATAVRPAPASPRQTARQAGQKQAPGNVVRKAPGGLIFAFILSLLLLFGLAGFVGYHYNEFQTQKTNLRVKEADLTLRESELDTLRENLADKEKQLAAAQDEIQALEHEIARLKQSLSGNASSLSQTQYDMTTQQQELQRLTEENSELLGMVENLEKENGTLQKSVSELTATVSAYLEKIGFFDAYVVFVENDGTNLYHKYDCPKFTKKSFWAYSTKLAESSGFSPCSSCN